MTLTLKRNPVLLFNRFFLLAMLCVSLLATPFQIFLYASLLLYIIFLIIANKWESLSWGYADYFLAAFLVASIISSVFAKHKTEAFSGAAVFILYFIVYFYFKNILMDEVFYKKMIVEIAVSLIIWCGFALIHYYIIQRTIYIGTLKIMSIHPWLSDKPLISIFEHPAVGGNLIAIVMTFVLSFLSFNFNNMKIWEKTLFSLALLISIYTAVLTLTRSAMIFIGVSVLVTVIITKRYRILVVILILGIILIFLPNKKIGNTLKNPMNSLNVPGRMLQYKAGIDSFFRNNPLWGIGLLNFQYDFEKNYSGSSDYVKVPYIHNNYLSILAETGLLGFLSFFGFIIFLIIKLIKNNSGSWTPNTLNGVVLLGAFLVNSIFDAVLYTVPIALFIWIAAGLSQNRNIGYKSQNQLSIEQENKSNA